MDRRHLVFLVFTGVVVVSGATIVAADVTASRPAEVQAAMTSNVDESTLNDTRVPVIVTFDSFDARETASLDEDVTVTGGHDVDISPVLFAQMPEATIDRVANRSDVTSVTVNSVVSVGPGNNTTDNSARISSQLVPWGVDRIDAPEASDTVPESARSDVTVAVLDTGVDHTHSDLDETVSWGANFSNGASETGPSAGMDNHGHGTAAAGIVAAEDDGSGVVGVATGTELYAMKVLNRTGQARISWIVSGIDAAVKGPDGDLGTDDDADVVSMSLGSYEASNTLKEQVDDASQYALVVSSVGNSGDGDPDTNEVEYPAKYNSSIGVAATDTGDEIPTFSAEGTEVEIAAPGVNVETTSLGGGTGYFSGTSAAAPHVSGVAALVIADDLADGERDLSNGEIRTRLRETARDIGPDGVDPFAGHGLVRADEALGLAADPPTFGITGLDPTSQEVTSGESFDVSATVENTGGPGEQTVVLRLDGESVAQRQVSLGSGDQETVTFSDVSTDGLEPGSYGYEVASENDTASGTLTVQASPAFEIVSVTPTDPTVAAGETFDVSATVENTGGDGTRTVSVQIDDERIVEQDVTLTEGERETLSFTDVPTDGLASGTHSYQVTAEDDSVDGTLTIEQQTIVVSAPGQTSPGENVTLDVTVTNTGSDPATDPTLTIESPDAVSASGPTERSFDGSLAVGDSWTTSTPFSVDDDVDMDSIAFDVTADLNGSTTTRNHSIDVDQSPIALGGPSSLSATPGSTVNATLTLTNRQVADASSGGIQVASVADPITVRGSRAVFLGLDRPIPEPGESLQHTVTFEVPDGTSPGTYPVETEAAIGDAWGTHNATITVSDVDRFDRNDPSGEIGFQDVLDAIGAYNAEETVGGDSVTFQDILDVIEAYNV